MIVEVNGVSYVQKEQKTGGYVSPRLQSLFMMALAFGGLEYGMSGKSGRERPEVNIIDEFRLIQQKKSNLSKNNRDWVEKQFHSKFKVLKEIVK